MIWSLAYWAAAALVIICYLIVRKNSSLSQNEQVDLSILIFFLLAIFLRLYPLPTFMGNRLASDEVWVSIINIADTTNWLPTYRAGGTQLAITLVMDLWYWIVGFGDDAYYVRLPAVIVGIASVWLQFLWTRRLYGITAGRVSMGLLAVNAYAIYFSKLGVDIIWSLFAINMFIWLLTEHFRGPSVWRALLAGTLGGALIFTYPSYEMTLLSLVAAGIFFSFSNSYREALRPIISVRHSPLILGSFTLIVSIFLFFHYRYFATNYSAPLAGGNLSLTFWKENLLRVFQDYTTRANGWLTPYNAIPFIEPAAWVLAVIALPLRKTNTIALTGVMITILAVSISGPYGGARRTLAVLPIVFALAGQGASVVFHKSSWAFAVVILTLMIPSLIFQTRFAWRQDRTYIGRDMKAPLYPTEALWDLLRKGPIMIFNEGLNYYDIYYYRSIARLGKRYSGVPVDRLKFAHANEVSSEMTDDTTMLVYDNFIFQNFLRTTERCLASDSYTVINGWITLDPERLKLTGKCPSSHSFEK